MSNHLGELRSPNAHRPRKRVGRGQGSGHGGTSTRGHKGAGSRSGTSRKLAFEGGQMPYVRRVPKFGFRNHSRVEYQEVNLAQLQALVDKGRLDGGNVTPETLYSAGAVAHRTAPVKVLGNGDISTALTLTVHSISAAARTKIEGAGGTVSLHE